MSKNITNNQRPTLNVIDSVSNTPFTVKGNSSDGALFVDVQSGGGGGTQYTDGGTPPTHPIGNALEFNNAGTWATVGTSNPLPITGSISVGGTVDESTFTAGTSTFTSSGGVFNDSVATLSSGQQGAQRLTTNRAIHINLRTAAGVETGIAAAPLQVSLANTGANGTALAVTISGNQAVNIAQVGGASLALGQALAAASLPVVLTASQLTSIQQPTLQSGSTTAVTQGTGTNLHTVIDSGTITSITNSVTISGAVTEATLDAALIAQEATTSGIKGLTAFGAVTTNAPTYSTTKSDALSLDTSGLLRISLKDTPSNTNKILVTADAITVAASQTIAVTNTGTFAVQATLSAETTKVIGTVNQGTSPWVVGQGTAANLNATVVGTGTFAVQAALSAGTNAIGTVNLSPTTVGGWTPYFANAITTTVTVSGSAGKFGGYSLINLNATPAYLQCFDTTGAVTLGSTAPTFVITLPANSTAANGVAANLEMVNGINLANGLKVAATTTPNGASTVGTGLSGSIMYH